MMSSPAFRSNRFSAVCCCAASLLLTGCLRFQCVSTCQGDGFTYTVFIGEVCAKDEADAQTLSAAEQPCTDGDPLLSTDCQNFDTDGCLFRGVLIPLHPERDPRFP